MTVPVLLEFTGTLVPASMDAFARHRAQRLDLGLEILESAPDRFLVAVSGPPELTAAFEMALSLGPADSLIRAIRHHHDDGLPPTTRRSQEG
ncbi:hypothetical protein [Pararhodobacter marinus]|uniref:hypothetical protein n=1 Tax=Pararhodobacter marinus TaxID=2184063 RepID=UPI0035197B90